MTSPYAYAGMKEVILSNSMLSSDFNDAKAGEIISLVSKFFKVSETDVCKKGRNEPFVTIRHICIYFIRKKTGLTLHAIGKHFGKDKEGDGKLDHTGIIHAISLVQSQMSLKSDNPIKDAVSKLSMII